MKIIEAYTVYLKNNFTTLIRNIIQIIWNDSQSLFHLTFLRKIQAQACKESEKKIHALAKNASEKPIDGKEIKKEKDKLWAAQ